VVKRKKKLSKKYYGTSHTLSKDEAKRSLYWRRDVSCCRFLRQRFNKLSACVAIRILANAKHIMENAAFARSSTFTPLRPVILRRQATSRNATL
jgi:hypothetical protein